MEMSFAASAPGTSFIPGASGISFAPRRPDMEFEGKDGVA